MRIVINKPIDVSSQYWYIENSSLLKDFKKGSVFIKEGIIVEQKVDLEEAAMNDLFLWHLEMMGVRVVLEMYNVGRYTMAADVSSLTLWLE